ncbi:BgTH12-01890 [Blumeria graminis f. sp. triticale]|uniref:BgtE-5660 n=3 Tax=Blumeria graminis TaxID=34373 RepID=A0A061HS23_BLUGR|nr:putative secreted effector protein [Blumeria graminis f. sp. tritici 96224]CAD6501640.1 BgTH12-01890 [Blumeria graminis f. sp. triticale]VDB84227.1 BgtE-5660 [Blumeria graminis f. sp. tritici]
MQIHPGILVIAATLIHLRPVYSAQSATLVQAESLIKCGQTSYNHNDAYTSTVNAFNSRVYEAFNGRTRCGVPGDTYWMAPLKKQNGLYSDGSYVIFDNRQRIVDVIYSLYQNYFKLCYVSNQQTCPENHQQPSRPYTLYAWPVGSFLASTQYSNDITGYWRSQSYVVGNSASYQIGIGPAYISSRTSTVSFYQSGD